MVVFAWLLATVVMRGNAARNRMETPVVRWVEVHRLAVAGGF